MSYSSHNNGNERSSRPMHFSPTLLSTLYNGIENQKVVELEYESREKGVTNRLVEPMSIVQRQGKKHLVAWCRLRNAYRTFIIDRLTTAKIKNETFERRSDFDESQFLADFPSVATEGSIAS